MMVRLATLADLDEILRLAADAFGASAWSRRMFLRILEEAERSPLSRTVLVGSGMQGAIGGYVVAQRAADEAEIQALAVAAVQRRHGLGSELVGAVLERLASQSVKLVFLEVRVSNLGAQAFYRHLGFSEYGRRPQYYRSPIEDAVLMHRWLQSAATQKP
jgi:ribosomal-protein-alanine N-acetyltransferase